jgi:hypothetical protein
MHTQESRPDPRMLTAGLLLAILFSQSGSPIAAAGRAVELGAGRAQDDRTGPCRLLALADVQQVFAGAKPATLNRTMEKYGLLTCIWDHAGGRLSIIEGDDAEESVMEEARGWTLTFLDPLKPQAEKQVRYDRLPGVGDEAVAIVERTDATKGFINDGAILVVRRGKKHASVLSTELGRRERAEALKAFTLLGKAVAARLNAS